MPTLTNHPAPVAVVDLISSLLESTVNSIFRFIEEGSPHVSRATVEIRRPLQEMVVANHRRAGELAALLESLGGQPTVQSTVSPDEQYLAFLSLKFLLPKLVGEKKLCLQHYDNALEGVKRLPQVPPEVPALFTRHREQQRQELAALEAAAAHVAALRDGKKDPTKSAAGQAGPAAGPAAR